MQYHVLFGWLGGVLFALCAIPQALKTWRTKRADDLSLSFLLLWLLGELFTFSYVAIDDATSSTLHLPLYINYAFNIVLVAYLIYATYSYKTVSAQQ